MKSLPFLLKPKVGKVMANNGERKIKPFVALVEGEKNLTAECHEQNNSSSSDGSETRCNDDQTSKQLTLPRDENEIRIVEEEFATAESESQERLFQGGLLRKRCHWVEDTQEPFSAEEANSSSTSNFPISPLKRIHGRRRWNGQKSPSPVQNLKGEECHFDYCFDYSRSTPPIAYPRHMQVCLPPGCIPTEVMVQVPQHATQSTLQLRDVMTEDTEVDPWMKDICNQAMTLQNFAQPVTASALAVPGDLEGDVSQGKSQHFTDKVLGLFMQNQKGVGRRNAICEELEKTTSFVKINGAKLSLWHLRAELINTLKITKL